MDGEKPLAVLIPGLDGTGLLYFRQVDTLAPRYRVRPWRFGTGSRFDYPDLVEEIGAEISEEPPGSAVVVGESFGGTIAIQVALAFPDRLRRLVLVNTFPHYRGRVRIVLARKLAPFLPFRGVRRIKNWIVERTLIAEGILKEDLVRYNECIRQVDLNAYCRRLELIRQVDLRPRLKEIAVPTLIFASGRDKIVPSVREARAMAALIPGSRLYEFPRAGHGLLLTPGFLLSDYV
jgi:pimeloyl-ACP methyl ester carboxylesterase